MAKSRPVVLAILDGFGIWREKRGNPILAAKTPNLDFFSRNFPGVALQASAGLGRGSRTILGRNGQLGSRPH